MESQADRFLRELAGSKRVVVIGGLAVIAHGYSRSTYDGDVWLEPMDSTAEWCEFLEGECVKFGGLTLHRLPGWTGVSGEGMVEAVEETNMVRILGLNFPLDVFRKPNELEIGNFEGVCMRATPKGDGTLLPHPLDLIQSKMETGRDKDLHDILFLESVIREDYRKRLPSVPYEEAREMLERYSEWQVLVPALENPSPEVRVLAMEHLREFAAAGDPFSLAILEGRKLP